MPFISSLKETFATAPIQDREAVVQKLATANTEDANYFQGLIILQKIYDEVMEQEEPTKARDPTSTERDLSTQMQNLLNSISKYSQKYTELNTRYHLLIYPFETAKSIEFIKSGLNLDLLTQKQEQQGQLQTNENNTTTTASILDSNLIVGFNVLKSSFDRYQLNNRDLDIEVLAFPELKSAILDKNLLNDDEEAAVLKEIFAHPTENLFGSNLMDRLSRLWKLQKSYDSPEYSAWQLENLPFNNFTLAQFDQLIKNIPEIVLLDRNFVYAYLEKLIPTRYYNSYNNGDSITFWDDDENILQDYLKRLDDFVEKLPPLYFQLKSAVKFHQLRVDIVRQNFEENSLIQYLANASNKSAAFSPIPSHIANMFSLNRPNDTAVAHNNYDSTTTISIDIPLLGSCEIPEKDQVLVVQEYLTGLIMQEKFSSNIESLGAYLDYHNVLKPLYAKIMLTTSPVIQQSWADMLGSTRYENLVEESSVSFTPSTLNASVKRKPNDPIHLSVRTKNIQRLSIRVFQFDTENYCRMYMDSDARTISDKNNKIDLDGLCPTWEKDIDFSSEPAIRVKTNNFIFGGEGLAPDVFKGRGIWVIEFVGGQNQCRAIIQKGYLRHVIQETAAGHIVRVLDENGQPLERSKIWCTNQFFQADESNNILIPYFSFDTEAKMSKMLLMSTFDEFCEYASFYRLAEKYKLEADFYVNPEMVSFNKKATVIVNPRLTMNGLSVSLSLLEKTSLVVECTNIDMVTNTSTCQSIGAYADTIHFEFLVPDRLINLKFRLQAKIKTLNGTLHTIDVKHRIRYESTANQSGVPASIQLRKTADNKYFIHAFGTNGEPKKDYEVSLQLKHAYLQYPYIDVNLKTNDEGSIELGELANIQWINFTNIPGDYKQWLINNDKQSLLPPAVCVSANTPFKIACSSPTLPDSLFSLYKTGVGETLIENVSAHIERKESHITVSALPAGEYMLYIASTSEGISQVKCTVIEGDVDSVHSPAAENANKNRFWSDWVIGKNSYSKQNGTILQRPLDISKVSVSDDNASVTVQLQNWSSKSFAIVTTSTFVPTSFESLTSLMACRSLTRPIPQDSAISGTNSIFLDDKTLGEEYQYVLNRAKSEKWVGSNLTKPTLLMYPKKNASTTARSRILRNEMTRCRDMAKKSMYLMQQQQQQQAQRQALCFNKMMGDSGSAHTSLAFLAHNSPILVLPVSADGTITIDRESLGYGGNLLQVVAFSGEQAVWKNTVLPPTSDSSLFRFNDLRQNASSNKAFIRSKVAKSLLPNEKLIIGTNEYEIIDSFEKLFDIVKTISNVDNSLAKEFDYLKTWSGLDVKKKLKLHEEKVCHELNFWLKRKDTVFFEKFIRPAIKSKIQKSFMDLYLIDEDLSMYSNDIYMYGSLSTAEKALLATTRPKDFAQTVLRSFKETFDDKKLDDRSDVIFDTILAGGNMNAVTATAITTEAVETVGHEVLAASIPVAPMARSFGFGSALAAPMSGVFSSVPGGGLFGSAPAPPPQMNALSAPTRERAANYSPQSPAYSPEDGPVDDGDFELQEAANELREKAKQRQKKVAYEFTKQTSEWVETGYYNNHDNIQVKQFWIDYLEYHLNKTDDSLQQNVFLSENYMYSLGNLSEILYVLTLMDLPFASEANWTREAIQASSEDGENNSNGIQLAICASASHPLMVFYRTLTESQEPFSSVTGNSDNNLMLGQELFLFDKNTPIDSDECIKINPLSSHFESLVEYGSHVIISNVSGKTLTCQVTVQIPSGSVPCNNTPYCRSKTISISPYSTWHEVTGTFYFPSAGEYAVVPVTVSSLSGDKLLGKIESMDIKVIDKSSASCTIVAGDNAADAQSLSLASWPTLANTGTSANVISFIESYKRLDRLDFSMISWRMKDKAFARQVFDILSKQRYFYSQELWKYGIYHQFDDIVRDLLQFDRRNLLDNTGQVFDSPLISKKQMDDNSNQVFDYYPLLNARAHPLKSTSHEILNAQFYEKYDGFLTYLSQQTAQPSNTDLVILTLYLILQDRIGSAQTTFARIQRDQNDIDCQVQIDYIEAYLKTRIPVVGQMEQQLQDLESVKEIASKYKDFGVLKWRELFAELYEFVNEVEQGDCTGSDDSRNNSTRRIQSEPILEFEINQERQELVVQYANLKSIDVKYYEMNIEVMFSTNPFMNDRSANMLTKDNFTWIKPNYSTRIDLPENKKSALESVLTEDDYNMIGVGQINSVQTMNIPFTGGNKNVFVEISSVDTANTIKRRQAYFSHSLHAHIAESYGIVRVMSGKTKRPLAGAYVKVYAKLKQGGSAQFWKDGYTGLNGVFDYIGVTEGNALMGGEDTDLKSLMDEKIDKLSILVVSADEGAVVKEAYPPLTC